MPEVNVETAENAQLRKRAILTCGRDGVVCANMVWWEPNPIDKFRAW